MASIDKTYLTSKEDYYKIKEWAQQYPIIYKSFCQYKDDFLDKAKEFPIWNTNRMQDVILAQYCPFKVVQKRLKEQYPDEYQSLRHESWVITCLKELLNQSLYTQRDDSRNIHLCNLLKYYLQSSYYSAMIGTYLHLLDISKVTSYRYNSYENTITVFITTVGNKLSSIEIGKNSFFRWVKRRSSAYNEYLAPIENLEW